MRFNPFRRLNFKIVFSWLLSIGFIDGEINQGECFNSCWVKAMHACAADVEGPNALTAIHHEWMPADKFSRQYWLFRPSASKIKWNILHFNRSC